MPNWCDVTYKIIGDKKELNKLYRTISSLEKRKRPYIKNGFGNLWLGCLVNKLGGDWEKVYCRGEITDYELEGGILTINQNTAWCEQEDFRYFLEQTFPSISIFYREEEPGCDVYYTNDSAGTYFPERFLLDGTDTWEYFDKIEDAAKYVASIVGHDVSATCTAITEALDEYTESKDDDDLWYSFHEFTVVD